MKLSSTEIVLINTRLQPGGEGVGSEEPFQRLAGGGKTVETVLSALTGLKPGVNENPLLLQIKFNNHTDL